MQPAEIYVALSREHLGDEKKNSKLVPYKCKKKW